MTDATNPLQPFFNLTQANLMALSKYAMSPEAMSRAIAQFQEAMTQGPQGISDRLAQSPTAFAELSQEITANYTRFMSEMAQSGMAAFRGGR
ncbi:MAG TPA: hypothetical protein VFP68_04240 [Burkholderiaceae bacterium]|nr:hypothetical protein [Burkholderiaceae bacterium]